jgi:hypothetical protein
LFLSRLVELTALTIVRDFVGFWTGFLGLGIFFALIGFFTFFFACFSAFYPGVPEF